MDDLKSRYTVAIVTHNMQQAARIADYTAFFLVGKWWNTLQQMNCLPCQRIRGQRTISRDVLDDCAGLPLQGFMQCRIVGVHRKKGITDECKGNL